MSHPIEEQRDVAARTAAPCKPTKPSKKFPYKPPPWRPRPRPIPRLRLLGVPLA